MPGIRYAWTIAWVDDWQTADPQWTPEVHTPWGDLDVIPLEVEIYITGLELRVERSTPYVPQRVGARGYRKPEDGHLGYGWFIGPETTYGIIVRCPYMVDRNGEEIGELIYEGAYPEEEWGTQVVPSGGRIRVEMHDGRAGWDYVVARLGCEEYSSRWDGLDVTVGQPGSGRIRLYGDGDEIRCAVLEDYDRGPQPPLYAHANIGQTFGINLSGLGVYTAERGKLAEVRDDCELDLFGHTAPLSYWRNFTADNPLVIQHTSWQGWMDNSGLEGTCTGPLIAPRINADWAEEHGHSPDDLLIHIDAGGLDWPCQGSPYRELITVEHPRVLEVFNPLGAEECPARLVAGEGISGEWATGHAGWSEYGAGWLLQIDPQAADLRVEFALRSNMEDRVEQAKAGPDYTIPEGYGPEWYPPPIPDCHRIRAAGGWLPDQEPAESVCDWDNFGWLRLTLACSGEWRPEDCRIWVGFLLPVISDNFLPGDARRTGGEHGTPYKVVWGPLHWLEYKIRPPEDGEDGYRYICLLQPEWPERGVGDGRAWPDLRWVRMIRLDLPPEVRGEEVFVGGHLTGPVEPRWRSNTEPSDPALAVHATIPEVTDGDSTAGPDFGLSIVTDGKPGARTICPWLPRVEEGVPYYYYVEGAASGYDLGTVATWRQVAAELGKQEGFRPILHEDRYVAMVFEGGDPEAPQLWEPSAADWQEGSAETGRLRYGADGAVDVTFAQRVRTVSPPGLWRYDVHALKHLAGGVWGCAVGRDGPVSDVARIAARTWEREDSGGEWAELGRAYASEASPLALWPMVRGALWQTGIGYGARIAGLGVLPVREFWWVLYFLYFSSADEALRGRIGMYTDQYGVAWVAWTDGEQVYVARLLRQADVSGLSVWSDPDVVATVEGALAVGITGDGRVIRVGVATDDHVLELHTLDRGATWSEPVTIA